MKTKKFLVLRNIFFILIALALAAGLTAGWRATTNDSPEELQVADLIISPNPAQVGESVSVEAYVTNRGGSEDTHTIISKVNGQEIEGGTAEVPVPAGKTSMVEFTLTINVAGTYQIEADGLSRTLEVTGQFQVANLVISPATAGWERGSPSPRR